MHLRGHRWQGISKAAAFVFLFLYLQAFPSLMALDPGKIITQYRVQVWNMEGGLPGNSVFAILQTQDGYLWIGTQDGLVRFDGLNFELFSTGNTPGLKDNMIRALYAERNGRLWIGTSAGGLTFYRDAEFTNYSITQHQFLYKISAIDEDRWGNLWIGSITGGLTCLNLTTDTFTNYTIKQGLPHNQVRFIYKDGNRDLWVTTAAGIVKLLQPGNFQVYAPQDQLPYFKTVCLYEEDTNTLWIGTGGNGLFQLKNQQFTAYGTEAGIPNLTITSLFRDRMKNLWVGTDGGGLTRIRNNLSGTLTGEDGLADGFVYPIYEDREGSLWVGTLDGGLHQLRDSKFTTYAGKEGLSHDYVNCIYKDRAGDLLIGTKAGLDKLKLRNRTVTTVLTGRQGLLSSNVLCLFEDQSGYLWIGTLEGLHRFKDGKLTPFTTRDGLSHNWITCIHADTRGNTWIGTGNGLNRLTLNTSNDGAGQVTVFTTREGLCSNLIEFIFEDRKGALWIGTDAGLNRIREGEITTYNPGTGFGDNHFQCVYQDSGRVFWFGTKRGLIRLILTEEAASPPNQTHTFAFTVQSGLIDNDVSSILEDERGYLWIGGRNGISRVRKKELEAFSRGDIHQLQPDWYNEKDGMKSRWCTETGYKTRDGGFWFPTSVGVTSIDPHNIPRNRIPPQLIIEKIIVDGDPIKIKSSCGGGKKREAGKTEFRGQGTVEATSNKKFLRGGPGGAVFSKSAPLAAGGILELSPGKKRLEFYYTAVSFINPGKIKFKAMLEGYDNDWVDVGTSRHITYTGLSPGNYTFKVIACNPDGVWNEKGASFSFYLQPHWYKTWWAVSLYVLFVFSGVFFFVKWRSTKLTMEKARLEGLVNERTLEIKEKNLQLQEQSEKLKEMDKAKSLFFANISHEFRTPLTLIMGPLEQILSYPADRKMKATASMMLRNSRRLLTLVNQLLELAQLDSGKMKLEASRQNIVPFLKSIIMCFESLALQNKIELTFQRKEKTISLYFDPEKLEKIITNLLSNAFNYTPVGGKITISVQRLTEIQGFPSGCVEISVRDSGIGIPLDQLPHIFDRFYRGGGNHEYKRKGTGIGLALSKELIELHQGQIHVHSQEGKNSGTEFIIRLPLGDEHLNPDQIVRPSQNQENSGHSPENPALYMIDQKEYVKETETDRDDNEKGTVETSQVAVPEVHEKDIILVVEDNADVRKYIRGVLEPRYLVEEAKDGCQGIKRAKEIIPDLIISDIMMPGVDGYKLCQDLKTDIITSHIPIILLTAKASEASILQGLETGADDYIIKPFNTKILMTRIRNLILLRQQLHRKIKRQMLLQPVEISISSMDEMFLKELQKVIEENLGDPEFDVDALCKKLYMSQPTLYRKIRALTGESPTLFIQSYRLKRAAQLLKANFGNVTEVAYEVGFSSSAYFTVCFKEKFHRLPHTFLTTDRE
jgi:signal transduction histidine kinase/ligand-binding sensor domain-containing protein/DNA-binding response OmpR family regulator